MDLTHRAHVEALLARAAASHAMLVASLPEALAASVPVDGQGATRAINHLAIAAGYSDEDRRALLRPHAVNPAVLHARVFGGEPLTQDTIVGSFVEGARVRADALTAIADQIGGEPLVHDVRAILVAHPPPLTADSDDVADALRATYAAHEQAAIRIAAFLDDRR